MVCFGKWSEDWTEQLTADICIPMKTGECWNHCPVECPKDEILCPGHIDPETGCSAADFCHHGSKYQVSVNEWQCVIYQNLLHYRLFIDFTQISAPLCAMKKR